MPWPESAKKSEILSEMVVSKIAQELLFEIEKLVIIIEVLYSELKKYKAASTDCWFAMVKFDTFKITSLLK